MKYTFSPFVHVVAVLFGERKTSELLEDDDTFLYYLPTDRETGREGGCSAEHSQFFTLAS